MRWIDRQTTERMGRALITAILSLSALSAAQGSSAHWETVTIEGGAELLTLFAAPASAADEEAPLLTVLRDTLGDGNPDNDRLSYVWLHSETRRSRWRKWLTREPSPGAVPPPLLDLSDPDRGMWKGVLRAMLQSLLLDPSGLAVRAPSRSYFSSEAASRTVQLFETVTVLMRLETQAQLGPLSPEEYSTLLSRIILAERTLGGLVSDGNLERVRSRELGARRQALARNWELLRQRAETEGLYFQPIASGDGPAAAALLWVSRADLRQAAPRRYRAAFLDIADPWNDPALRHWTGYSERWHFDAEGRRILELSAAFRSEEMIPLALYSLDHRKAPLLLIDFRSTWKPAARELARRTAEEVPSTLLGAVTFASWELRAAQILWNFVRGRQGAAVNRSARLRAAAAVRQSVLDASELHPDLQADLRKRLGAAQPSFDGRYQVLLAAVGTDHGLQRHLGKERGRELAGLLHPQRSRWLSAVSIATFGFFRYRVEPTLQRMEVLDRERRVAHAVRTLETALARSPVIGVDGDLDEIRRAVKDLAILSESSRTPRDRLSYLVAEAAARTDDQQARAEFAAALRRLVNGGMDAYPAGGGED